jgi:hypothetical protein
MDTVRDCSTEEEEEGLEESDYHDGGSGWSFEPPYRGKRLHSDRLV